MPQLENCPTGGVARGESFKSSPRLVLRGQRRPKKALEDLVNIHRTPSPPKSLRSFQTKIPMLSPRRTRLSILPKYQTVSSASPTPKLELEAKLNDVFSTDLEIRIRNALAASARRRAENIKSIHQESATDSAESSSRSGTIKSVRWDPAIISLGDTLRKASTESQDKAPTTPRTNSERIATHSKSEVDLDDLFDTLVRWKSKDPSKVQQLMDELNGGRSLIRTASSIFEAPTEKITSTSSTSSGETKKLDPSAPPFSNISNTSTKILHKHSKRNKVSQICLPKLQHARSLDDMQQSLQPPIWMNTTDALPAWPQQFQHVPGTVSFPLSQPIPFNPILFVTPSLPVLPQEPLIPSQDGHGRVAQAIDSAWADAILENFTKKYPLTGKLKAKPPVQASGRYAAEIQQRLEYVLLREKERKAFAQMDVM